MRKIIIRLKKNVQRRVDSWLKATHRGTAEDSAEFIEIECKVDHVIPKNRLTPSMLV